MEEIERKWILKEVPSFLNTSPIQYERHFLYNSNGVEIRIQLKGDKYEIERKVEKKDGTRLVQKTEITPEEFNYFKKYSIGSIMRESYLIPNFGGGSIKVYKGRLAGLIRVEVEFEHSAEMRVFEPLPWFGKEITDTKLARDKDLINIEISEFNNLLEKYND